MLHRWFVLVIAVSLVGLAASESLAHGGRGGGGRCSGGSGGGTPRMGGSTTDYYPSGNYVQGGGYNPMAQEAYRNYVQQRVASEAFKAQEKEEEKDRRLETVRTRRLEELAKREQRRRRIAQ